MDHAERSKLLNRHKQERVPVEKELKKAKGALKDKAQKKLDELLAKQEQELAAFDGGGAPAAAADTDAAAAGPSAAAPAEPAAKPITHFAPQHWDGYSKTELEAFCKERGVSGKGKKEDLVMKLIEFHSTHEYVEKEESEEEDEEDSESEGEVDAPMEELEKFAEKKKKLRPYFKEVVKRSDGGLHVDNFCAALEGLGVKNFAPQKVGFVSVHKLARNLANDRKPLWNYDKATGTLTLP